MGSGNTASAHTTLTEHWDGSSWTIIEPQPRNLRQPALGDGRIGHRRLGGRPDQGAAGSGPLIEHWDGTAWTVVPSPNPGSGAVLQSVSATSATNAWAADSPSPAPARHVHPALGWHRLDGRAQPQPRDRHRALLGRRHVGDQRVGGRFHGTDTGNATLIERWNGTAWTDVTSPSPGEQQPRVGLRHVVDQRLGGGHQRDRHGSQTLTERWAGTAWTLVTSPSPGTGSHLTSITATSATNAWAAVSRPSMPGGPPLRTVERPAWTGDQPQPRPGDQR